MNAKGVWPCIHGQVDLCVRDAAMTMAWHSFLLGAGTARGPFVIADSSPGVTLVHVSRMVVDRRPIDLWSRRVAMLTVGTLPKGFLGQWEAASLSGEVW